MCGLCVSCINATSLFTHASALSLGGMQLAQVRSASNDPVQTSSERHRMHAQNPPQRSGKSDAPAPPPRPTSNYGSTYQTVSGTLDPSVAVNVLRQQYIAPAGPARLPLPIYTPYDVGVSNNTGAYHLPARLSLSQNGLEAQASTAFQPMMVNEPVRTGWAMLERFGGAVQSHPPDSGQDGNPRMTNLSVDTHVGLSSHKVEVLANEVSGRFADRSR